MVKSNLANNMNTIQKIKSVSKIYDNIHRGSYAKVIKGY